MSTILYFSQQKFSRPRHPSLPLVHAVYFLLDTGFQTWYRSGLCTLVSNVHRCISIWKCLLHSTTSFTFLPPDETQVISWSVIKWLIRSSVKTNGRFPTVQNKSLCLAHKCITLNLDWFSLSVGIIPVLKASFPMVLQYNPSLYWQHLPALCHQYISPLHFYFSCLPRHGMEILIIILHAISVQILSWSPGKLDLLELPREKSIDFLLIRENLFFYQWNV